MSVGKGNLTIILVIFFVLPLNSFAQDVPFTKGVNLTNWFQASSVRQIQFTRYTKQDIENIKSLGCDVIRLPINLHYMTDGAPDYEIDPLFFEFLDQVVDWAEELKMNLILDNHSFDPAVNTDPNVGSILEKVWTQMAEHYQDRSTYIYYEVLNEPHGISDSQWNTIQQAVVQKIRDVDSKHTIVVGPAGWNSYNNLDDMPVYDDDNLIYTFHFYDPFVFTHQGATWTDPSMESLAGVPFPYNDSEMPDFPAGLNGTWVESAFNDYQNTGTVAKVKELIDIAVQFKNDRNVPVYCGEFGVYIPNSDNDDRVAWYDTVRTYLEENDIPWTSWDYHGGFGVFEEDGNGSFEHDLNIPLLEAIGFNTPPQSQYIQKPDSVGFLVYADYIGSGILSSGYSDGKVDLYSSDLPNNGTYSIFWTGASQYQTIGFDFQPNKDLSKLLNENFAIDLFIRGTTAGFSFDIRFLDTKTDDPDDHPWRMRYTIDDNAIDFNRKWQHVHIPLSDFTEQGAWDDSWFNPDGKFDWTAIDRMEIVTEQTPLDDGKLWFDNIFITDLDTAQVWVDEEFVEAPDEKPPAVTGLDTWNGDDLRIYPNPVMDVLSVQFQDDQPCEMLVFNSLGEVINLKLHIKEGEIDMSNLAGGMYFLKFYKKNGSVYQCKVLKR